MNPFHIRANNTEVEVWTGYRIQFEGMERHPWQKELKVELKQALSRLPISAGTPLSGYYDTTDPRSSDAENSLFTRWNRCLVVSPCCGSSAVLPLRLRLP